MRFVFLSVVLALITGTASSSLAFRNHEWTLGLSGYSQNAGGRTTNTDEGKPSFTGALSTLVTTQWTWAVGNSSFFSPLLMVTGAARNSAGDTAQNTLVILGLPFGGNFLGKQNTVWDWEVGPAVVQQTIMGPGGLKELNNGTTTATFAQAGRTTVSRTWALYAATNFQWARFRSGLYTAIQDPFSNQRRTFNLGLVMSLALLEGR
jgi:hypothetical protein